MAIDLRVLGRNLQQVGQLVSDILMKKYLAEKDLENTLKELEKRGEVEASLLEKRAGLEKELDEFRSALRQREEESQLLRKPEEELFSETPPELARYYRLALFGKTPEEQELGKRTVSTFSKAHALILRGGDVPEELLNEIPDDLRPFLEKERLNRALATAEIATRQSLAAERLGRAEDEALKELQDLQKIERAEKVRKKKDEATAFKLLTSKLTGLEKQYNAARQKLGLAMSKEGVKGIEKLLKHPEDYPESAKAYEVVNDLEQQFAEAKAELDAFREYLLRDRQIGEAGEETLDLASGEGAELVRLASEKIKDPVEAAKKIYEFALSEGKRVFVGGQPVSNPYDIARLVFGVGLDTKEGEKAAKKLKKLLLK